MPDLIEREDGTLALRTPADPAAADQQAVGWRRYSVGLDVGGRGEDPSALCIVKSECLPYLTGRGWEQALCAPRYSVVYTETARLPEATDVIDWTVSKLRQLKNWRLTFDATGMGAPLVSMFEQAKVDALAVTMTAGAAITREGNRVRVSKNLLLENAAAKFETGELIIAHDLPEHLDLIREVSSVEFAQTSAGNLTLQSGGRGHHADRFVALCLALLAETHIGARSISVTKLRGFYG
jgi:phage FluMu gp28-like protein